MDNASLKVLVWDGEQPQNTLLQKPSLETKLVEVPKGVGGVAETS